jgi:hypothetical protein
MDAHPVGDVDRLLAVVEANVDVLAEQQLSSGLMRSGGCPSSSDSTALTRSSDSASRIMSSSSMPIV